MPDVRCVAEECQFNTDGLCIANSIDVDDTATCETYEEAEDAG